MRFLMWFVNHLMFSGVMMFAAGSAAIGSVSDGGAAAIGGSDGGGDTGTGTSSGTDGAGSADGGLDHGAGTADGTGDGTDPNAAAGDGTDPNAQVDGGDGRLIPAKYKDLFKGDKELKAMFFRDKAFKAEFPGGVPEAVQAKQLVEKFGGESGLTEVETELTEWRQMDEKFLKGDPSLPAYLAQQNPEAFTKMMTAGLQEFSKANPEMYQHVLGRVVFNTLRNADAMHAAYTTLSAMKDNPEAQKAAQELAGWYNGIQETASKVPEKKVDERTSALDKRTQELDAREHNSFVQSVNSQALPKLVTGIETELTREMKAAGQNVNLASLKKSDPDGYNLLMENCRAAVKREVLKDQQFIKNYDAALAEKNSAKAMKMLDGKHAKVLPEVIGKVYKAFRGISTAANPKPNNGAAGGEGKAAVPAGWVHVSAFPGGHAINHSHPETRVIDRKAVLKDGRKVTW